MSRCGPTRQANPSTSSPAPPTLGRRERHETLHDGVSRYFPSRPPSLRRFRNSLLLLTSAPTLATYLLPSDIRPVRRLPGSCHQQQLNLSAFSRTASCKTSRQPSQAGTACARKPTAKKVNPARLTLRPTTHLQVPRFAEHRTTLRTFRLRP